ncbi:MAG: hypothetical protein ACREBS_00975 [Nitrososphaerales archaeon]
MEVKSAIEVVIVAILISISAVTGFYAGTYYESFQRATATSIGLSTETTTMTELNQTIVGSLTYQLLPAISVVNFSAFDSPSCITTCFSLLVQNLGRQISPGSWKLFFRDLSHSKATEYLCNSTESVGLNETFVCSGTLASSFRSGDTLNVQVVAPNGAKAIGKVQQIPDWSTSATTTEVN